MSHSFSKFLEETCQHCVDSMTADHELANPYHNTLVNDYDYTFKGHKKLNGSMNMSRQYTFTHPDLGKIKMFTNPSAPEGQKVHFHVNKTFSTPESLHSTIMNTPIKEEHIGFKNLENKLEDQGKSKKSAGKIAAYIGFKKYGKRNMAKAAKAGKPLHESDFDPDHGCLTCQNLADDKSGHECINCKRMVKLPKGTPVFDMENQRLVD